MVEVSKSKAGRRQKKSERSILGKEPIGAVMVVGGGIAGIQASLDLVEMGYRTYLVESSPSIGGVMGQLDKTFPTNDCSMCILSPKLVEVGSCENIEVLTLSEVLKIDGSPGSFVVTVKVNPRYVDVEKCTGCGICSEHCRVKVKDPYNAGLIRVPLIRVPFPQAVPGAAFIDGTKCLQILKGKCGDCKKACPAGAIDYSDKEKILEIKVGSVILATGYKVFDARKKGEYGYGLFPNVLTSIEFERILVANGPTGGKVLRRSDGKPAKKIAFIQCVGSRDTSLGNPYCSSVCCMYAIKQAVIAKEHSEEIKPTIFYIDIRAHGKGFEDYYSRARKEHGVRFIRCIPSSAKEIVPSGNILLSYVMEDGEVCEEEFDLVVLSVGIEPSSSAFGFPDIASDRYGFVLSEPFQAVFTSRPGIYACGVVQSPKDIPESVVQASAAAGMASVQVKDARGLLLEKKEYPPERDVRAEEPRIGVVVCHCGTNIGGVVDVPEVVRYSRGLKHVVFADERLYACSQDAQGWIREIISEHNLNRLVVASCTPRTHQPLFRETMRSAGLNKYLFEMANIREQCSWVHMGSPREATEKAKRLVRMAVSKASLLEPLEDGVSPVTKAALVVGGGISGMTAALRLADSGFPVFLVEKEGQLGGNARHIMRTLEGAQVQEMLASLEKKVMEHPQIRIFLSSKIVSVDGYVGSFKTRIENGDGGEEFEHGVVIIATGGEEYKPREGEYMFGLDPRVITLTELERRIFSEPGMISGAKEVVMIQCVGSRAPERPYCSKVCCRSSIKNALELKNLNQDTKIYICYRDIRTYGLSEDYYREAREKGINFIRFEEDSPPYVEKQGESIVVKVKDANLRGEERIIKPDLVSLACGIVANPFAQELGKMLKVPVTSDGFFLEAHVKLRPVDFATDGVFLAGLAHSPKTIEESIDQALAASARAETILAKEEVVTEGTVAFIDENICSGCGLCVSLCSFEAISLDEEKGIARVNPSLCKGCGTCAASCPSGANRLYGFRREQIYAQIESSMQDEMALVSGNDE